MLGRLLLVGMMLLVGAASAAADEPLDYLIPAGLKPLLVPKENPYLAAKVELGKQLYFDKRLSRDDSVSCATCHDPKKGWSNDDAFATGVRGQKGGRNSPTIINSAYQTLTFWDGRAELLEGQALGPIQNPIEMDMTLEELIPKLNKIKGYREEFQKIYKTDVTAEGIARAIAAFERTILSGDAPYDRFIAGDKTALSEAAQRGLKLFTGKANCSACHSGPNFSDNSFHNIGVGMDKEEPDLGRFAHTKQLGDRGAFKTPTLREIARHAPYMHDGRFKTLEEVVDYYNHGGTTNDQLDEEVFTLSLTPEQKADLVTFMKEGLASEKYPDVEPPTLPE